MKGDLGWTKDYESEEFIATIRRWVPLIGVLGRVSGWVLDRVLGSS